MSCSLSTITIISSTNLLSLIQTVASRQATTFKNYLVKRKHFLSKKISKELLAVFHSHVNTKEDASEYDIKNAKNCLYPFLIYSTVSEKFDIFDMPNFERDEKGVTKLKEAIND